MCVVTPIPFPIPIQAKQKKNPTAYTGQEEGIDKTASKINNEYRNLQTIQNPPSKRLF